MDNKNGREYYEKVMTKILKNRGDLVDVVKDPNRFCMLIKEDGIGKKEARVFFQAVKSRTRMFPHYNKEIIDCVYRL